MYIYKLQNCSNGHGLGPTNSMEIVMLQADGVRLRYCGNAPIRTISCTYIYYLGMLYKPVYCHFTIYYTTAMCINARTCVKGAMYVCKHIRLYKDC